MQPLVIHFNEQCLNGNWDARQWQVRMKNFCNAIDHLFELRSDARIVFPAGQWDAHCDGRPLRVRIKDSYSREKYRRLLLKVKQLTDNATPFLHEIHWNGQTAQGLTLAGAVQSWALSLCTPNSPWAHATITAQRYELDDNGNLNGPTPCEIRHLAIAPHVTHWTTEIRDWGATIAASCVLDKVKGHPVVMYQGPKEHNPPHVHLLDQSSRNSLAKYRIDVFERPEGPPTWDAEMTVWVNQYRDQLLQSWTRCQQGGLPYELMK